jgi:hypothetical protein
MEEYNRMIAHKLRNHILEANKRLGSPQHFRPSTLTGGIRYKETFRDVRPSNAYSYPSTLSTSKPYLDGVTYGDLKRGGKFSLKDIGNGLKKGASWTAKNILLPVAKDIGKDMIKSAITGAGRRRPIGLPKPRRLLNRTQDLEGAGFWKDFGEGFKKGFVGTAKVVGPIALKAMLGAGRGDRIRNRISNRVSSREAQGLPTPVATAYRSLQNHLNGGRRPSKKHLHILHQHVLEGGFGWKDIKKGLSYVHNNVLKPVGQALYPIAKEVGTELLNIGKEELKNYAKDELKKKLRPEKEEKEEKEGAGRKRRLVGTKRGNNARGDIVAEIMKKKGLSLPQASKYVKAHNLY